MLKLIVNKEIESRNKLYYDEWKIAIIYTTNGTNKLLQFKSSYKKQSASYKCMMRTQHLQAKDVLSLRH